MNETIIVAFISLTSSVIVALFSYAATRKSAKEGTDRTISMIQYRLEQLEKKVDQHNKVVERTFKLEGRMDEAEHDLRDMKARAS